MRIVRSGTVISSRKRMLYTVFAMLEYPKRRFRAKKYRPDRKILAARNSQPVMEQK